MCLPAAVLPAMAIASSVVSAAGSVMGGLQANAQGKYESAIAKRNSQMEVEAAHESYEAGKDERRDFWRKVGSLRGQQIASMAANGIDVSEGTPERIQRDTTMLAGEDAQNLYRNIEQRTRGHHITAANYTAEAKAARQRGKAALTSSLFQAGSSLISGATQYARLKGKFGTSTADN